MCMFVMGVLAAPVCAQQPLRNSPKVPDVTLDETVSPTPFVKIADSGGNITIRGRISAESGNVLVRVTNLAGRSSVAVIRAHAGRFQCKYPQAFAAVSSPLSAGALFIDATTDSSLDVSRPGHSQAEATLFLLGGADKFWDLPDGFTNCLRDQDGRTDRNSSQWAAQRALANLFEHSMAARLMHIDRHDFDLEKPADLSYFKQNLSMYAFETRDRDWNVPLNNRPARTFWNSVWRTWFNSSNDNPIDGNPKNQNTSNYEPYVFANDFADVTVSYLMRPHTQGLAKLLCREATQNLLAMQYTGPGNFAKTDSQGSLEHYTRGAFRYGMFENGNFMTEGLGWFYNPAFRDYAGGGVLNGRAIWALGESLRREPKGPLSKQTLSAITLGAQFCLEDGRAGRYTHTTRLGHTYWKDASEHAYLLLGLLAACRVAPETPAVTRDGKTISLRTMCAESLNALVDLIQADHTWSVYPNDAMCVAALAEGVEVLHTHPDHARWMQGLKETADRWIGFGVDSAEYPGEPVHFGIHTRATGSNMSFNWHHLAANIPDKNVIYLYHSGHWIHALSRAYAVTGDKRYRIRAEKMIAYLCGANPWHVRLFNELGGVYNWVEDTDGDGIEDYLKQDMYPESTAFSQIGIIHYIEAVYRR